MEFDQIYNDVLQLYPDIIDISNGQLMSETGDFDAPKLISSYEHAENIALSKGEWHSLVTWIIFQALHEMAKNHYIQGTRIFKKEIDKSKFRELLIENLQVEEYEDMLCEFAKYEKNKGTFK